MSEDLLQDHADATDDFDAFEDTGDLTEDSEERVVHVDDGNYGPTDEEDLGEVPPQSLDEVIDELHEHDETILAPISDQLKKAAGELLSPIALQGVSAHAKKRPISALDDRWLRSTWERITGLLSDQPDADEAPDWKHDVRLLEAAASERELDLWMPVGDAEPETPAKAPAATPGTIAVVSLSLKVVSPDPAQARDEGADDELADSIAEVGVLQPIRVYEDPIHPGFYIIEDGERRYRGSSKAGLTTIPALVVPAPESAADKLLLQVSANTGKPLKPMEEARAYKRIMADTGWTIQQLAVHLGRSKSTISDRIALADVPEAFRPLFEKGELTTAAAPIVRGLQDLPAAIAKEMIDFAKEGPQWERAVQDGKPVPLKVVESELVAAAKENDELYELRKDDKGVGDRYDGPAVSIGKSRFATDLTRIDLLLKHREVAEKAKGPPPKGQPAAPAPKPEPSKWQLEERKKVKAAKAKAELRRAQFAAIAPKLPTSIGGSVNQASGWSLFLVRYLLDELTHDTMRVACTALDLEPPKKGQHGGYNFAGALAKHAEKLSAPDRIRFALQLLVAADLNVSPNGSASPKRLEEAAKLAGVDLKKVKVEEPKAAPTPAAKKHKAKVRQLNAAFMQEYPLTEQLARVVGKGPMARTEVTKKLWQYIKRNGLQDKKERRMVHADALMRPIFGKKQQVSMFEMTKLINKHLIGFKA